MPQSSPASDSVFGLRVEKLRAAMRDQGQQAVVIEPGAAMMYLTGVRWGRSERTFAVIVPLRGRLVFVVPAFEESRARELIGSGADIRVWQEDDSPFQLIAELVSGAGAAKGRVGMDPNMRFFVFDGVRNALQGAEFGSAEQVFKTAGVESSGRGSGR